MKEATLDRSEFRRMHTEQERERRRIRDRQRRQSMTVEQRERHLARRRRNYQLRRLRAENAKLDFPSQQISNEHEGEEDEEDEHEAEDGAAGNDDVQEVIQLEKLSAQPLQYTECLEAVACNSGNFPKRVRLSHIRRFARSLNHLGGVVSGNQQIVADMTAKGDANNTSYVDSGRLPNGLRFNRVKRLARTLNIATNDTSVNGQKVEQNLLVEEVRVVGDDKPKFGPTISVGEVEGHNMDV